MSFEQSLKQMGKAMDDIADAAFPVLSEAIQSIGNALSTITVTPWSEAKLLKELSQEHELDLVERNNVRVRREEATLVAEYNDGSGWQHITNYKA